MARARGGDPRGGALELARLPRRRTGSLHSPDLGVCTACLMQAQRPARNSFRFADHTLAPPEEKYDERKKTLSSCPTVRTYLEQGI